jgi:heme oxygenase
LRDFYGVYAPLEETIERSVLRDHYRDRVKLPHLQQDLIFFGHTEKDLNALPKCMVISSPESLAELVGSLYVMEGSTLGALILVKHFHLRFHLGFLKGLSFFSGYADKTHVRWKEWREFSERFSKEMRLSEDEIGTHAKKTFVHLEEWLLR